jgi:hypothetical protein
MAGLAAPHYSLLGSVSAGSQSVLAKRWSEFVTDFPFFKEAPVVWTGGYPERTADYVRYSQAQRMMLEL